MQYIRRSLLTGIVTLALTLGLAGLAPQAVHADASTDAAKAAACQGAGGTAGENGKCTTDGPSLNNIIANVVNILSIMVGIAAVVMVLVGGFKYITSNGDSGNINGAKQTIVYAIIGLVIVAFAQFIVQFVIKETTTQKSKETNNTEADQLSGIS